MLVVIAGYLVWLRSKYQPTVSPKVQTEENMVEETPAATSSAQSATSSAQEATGSVKEKSSTPSSTNN